MEFQVSPAAPRPHIGPEVDRYTGIGRIAAIVRGVGPVPAIEDVGAPVPDQESFPSRPLSVSALAVPVRGSFPAVPLITAMPLSSIERSARPVAANDRRARASDAKIKILCYAIRHQSRFSEKNRHITLNYLKISDLHEIEVFII